MVQLPLTAQAHQMQRSERLVSLWHLIGEVGVLVQVGWERGQACF